MNIQITFNNVTKDIPVVTLPTIETLKNITSCMFQNLPSDFSLKYYDNEKDIISVSSDIELQEAGNHFKGSNLSFFIDHPVEYVDEDLTFFKNLELRTAFILSNFHHYTEEELKPIVQNFFTTCSQKVDTISEKAKNQFYEIKQAFEKKEVSTSIATHLEILKIQLSDLIERIKEVPKRIPENIRNIPNQTYDTIVNIPNQIPENIRNIPTQTVDTIKNIPNHIPENIKNIPNQTMDTINQTVDTIKNIPNQTMDTIKTIPNYIPENVRNIPNQTYDTIVNIPNQIPENIRNIPTQTYDTIVNIPNQIPENIKNIPNQTMDTIKNIPENIKTISNQTMDTINNQIPENIKNIPNQTMDTIKNIPNVFPEAIQKIKEIPNIIEYIKNNLFVKDESRDIEYQNNALNDLIKLEEMGFSDTMKNINLLEKHRGDLNRVVADLLK